MLRVFGAALGYGAVSGCLLKLVSPHHVRGVWATQIFARAGAEMYWVAIWIVRSRWGGWLTLGFVREGRKIQI